MCPVYEETRHTRVLMPIISGPLQMAHGQRCYGLPNRANERGIKPAGQNAQSFGGCQERDRRIETG